MDSGLTPQWLASAPRDPRGLLEVTTQTLVDVPDGQTRVLHHVPERSVGCRPVVVLPGFSAPIGPWQAVYAMLQGQVEFYVLETLEKASPPLHSPRPDLSFLGLARQVEATLEQLGLSQRDYVMMGASLLGTTLAEGMAAGVLKPPTAIAFDTLRRFWFPPWFLDWFAPLLPLWFLRFGLGPGARLLLSGMKEQAQRERLLAIVAAADPFRWRTSAHQNARYDLYERAPLIESEIFFTVGVGDRVHDDTVSRKAADLAPGGQLLCIPGGESQREALLGALLVELAKVPGGGLPESVGRYLE